MSIDWNSIETAPLDKLILLGTDNDPVDGISHRFFVHLGWWNTTLQAFWDVTQDSICFPSHWAPIDSPVAGAAVTFWKLLGPFAVESP